ncbi:MAG: aminoacyl-histidine dipeptidase, partial [Odoribacter sp.]|nr:aminoacyl-histidine dipeptidase [Odoribacter sp.]
MATLQDLQPQAVWQNFYKLTQVPRPSNHEEKAREFMLNWAKEKGIEARIDAAGNIIMSKPATPGMENRKGVILQGHLDMVPQKNEDTVHDFTQDAIQAYADGEWVRAKGTTLGADNGMGVAAAMAILTSTDVPHGPLEVLISATEETGMDGAIGLKAGELKGEILLNMDSETEGELYVGCAGGLDSTFEFHYQEEKSATDHSAYKLSMKGLKGGHSGMDINLGRGNSNLLLFRFLKANAEVTGLSLASVNGGSLRNAIPRESFAVVTVPKEKTGLFIQKVKEFASIYQSELQLTEPDLQFFAEETELPAQVMPKELQSRLINAIVACPNGVIRMSDAMPGTVETSNNLALIQSGKGKVVVNTLMRSFVETAKDALAESLDAVFKLAKADKIVFDGAYPGWKP